MVFVYICLSSLGPYKTSIIRAQTYNYRSLRILESKNKKMNKLIYIFLFILGTTSISEAQSVEKIKGNRNITIKQTYIDDFTSLVIKNDFEVKIAYNSKPSVEIEADDNLHDVINVDVINGQLSISTSKRITSRKKLVITVSFGEMLSSIDLHGDTELRSLTFMELDSLSLNVSGNSRAYLNIKANTFKFSSTDKSKSRLNINADSTTFILSDVSKLDALVNSKSSSFDIYQRATATIEGEAESSTLRIDNSGVISGKNYTIKNANLLIESSSDATLHVTEVLNLEASGTTETYIYGSSKINLTIFTDSAKLQKKELK